MNRFDKMKAEVLLAAKTAHEYLPVLTHELAHKYDIEHAHICEKLAEFHTERLILLSAWNEQENCDKPFDQWRSADYFFAYASDGNHKRIRLRARGAEFLDQIGSIDADRMFARMAIEEARKSVPEDDGKPHPWVGAVVVKNGKVLSTAHRGEVRGNHAEFIALERNLSDETVAGATVYTTLEPCTTRNRPKIPCADRLIERRVARVVIGILDPDERIRGKGQRKLSTAGIATSLFPHDLAMEVEELNRDFTRYCDQKSHTTHLQTPKSAAPDVLLQCEWRSLLTEPPQPPRSHVVRNRFWSLSVPSGGPVYNAQIGEIDFGSVFASFQPVDVLTAKSEARIGLIFDRRNSERIAGHDLESLITNPPDGCDINKYAVDLLSFEIPISVTYDDAHGDRFETSYTLKYEAYSQEGRLVRRGGIKARQQSTPIHSLEYRSTPTPLEIFDRIKSLPLFEQRSASNTYAGIPVEWPVRLIELSAIGVNSECDLLATYDYRGAQTSTGVTCSRIDLSKNPRLKSAYHNERLTVRGVIDRLDLSGEVVHLRDTDVVFPTGIGANANTNVLHEVRFDYLPESPLQREWIKVSHEDEHPRFDTFPPVPGSLRMRADGKVFAMDYLIPTKAEPSNHLKFIGEFGQGAILYAYITVVSKFGGLEEDWWFAHVVGDPKRSPAKESGREWKFYISPNRTKENHFDIDLTEEAKRVMDNGRYFSRIKKLRLRGDIILSPIKLVKN